MLTVRQPWAHLIAHGAKRIENRSRPTSYRGPLVVHAGLRPDDLDDDELAALYPPGTDLDALVEAMAWGAAVAVGDLYDCVPYAAVANDPYACGPWCWLLRDVRPLRSPIPCRGHLALVRVPDDLAARLAR